jgi:hypothetical protein
VLEAAVAALAATGGTAVVQAAGTDTWYGVRRAVARWFGRGDAAREEAALARLDRTAEAVAGDAAGDGRARAELAAAWRTRFTDLLEELGPEERASAAAELRLVLDAAAGTALSAGAGGVVVGGNLDIRAGSGSVAAAVIQGDVHLTRPSAPHDPDGD